MAEYKKQRLNWMLLTPVGLFILGIILYIGLLRAGYVISPFLTAVLILLGVFLVYQIWVQVEATRQGKHLLTRMEKAQEKADSGLPMEALLLWKKLLPDLPRDQYLKALAAMRRIYEQEGMTEAVQQVKAIKANTIEFFKMTRNYPLITTSDRKICQARAYDLHDMVKALPVNKEELLSETETKT